MPQTATRFPMAAGKFYPGDKAKLTKQIEKFLAQTKKDSISVGNEKAFQEKAKKKNRPRILILPHAGYLYSGQTAAAGFAHLENTLVSRVFLLGNSHQVFLKLASLSSRSSWQTPLGKTPVAQKIITNLADKSNWQINDEVHQNEHSLEVQLPFLQYILPNFEIVPILIGSFKLSYLQALAQDIYQNFNDQSILIISSDLSHYPSAGLAEKVDQELIKSITDQNLEKFKELLTQTAPEKNLQTRACGAAAIKLGLLLSRLLNCSQTKLFKYQHSGDVTGDNSRVVGYTSIGFFKQKESF